ncbi:hypothetical protein [Leptolyngbya sp. CCY15150]|uniref:hypothetical protein n=1 Tax=Leptolyngbya sp. CCY15150 TaxID=2767772 RepID=UPI00194E9A22|nr:hypothetical protein [Leptolyngbya sp. CCY15150]
MSQDVLAQAQTGDPKAIERLMNHTTRSRGIRTRVASQDGYLHILFESDRVIDQDKMTTFVRHSLVQLRVEAVSAVMVYGRQQHQPHVNWTSKVLLDSEPAEDSAEGISENSLEGISDHVPVAPPTAPESANHDLTSSLSEPSEPPSEQFEATSDLETPVVPEAEDYLAIAEPTQATDTDDFSPAPPPEAVPDDYADQGLADQRVTQDDATSSGLITDEPKAESQDSDWDSLSRFDVGETVDEPKAESQDSEWDSLSRFDITDTTDAESLQVDDVSFADVEFTSGNPDALTGALGDLQGGNPFQLLSPASENLQSDTADVATEQGIEPTADEPETEDSLDLDMDDDAAERNAAMEELLDNWDDDAADQQQPDFEMPSDDELRAVLFPHGDLPEPNFLEAEDHGWGDLAIAPDVAQADISEGNEDLDDADLDDLLFANEAAAKSPSRDEFDLDAFDGIDEDEIDEDEAEVDGEAIAESVWPEEATDTATDTADLDDLNDLDESLMFADQVDQSADNPWAELDEVQSEAADRDDLVFDDAAIEDGAESMDGGDRVFEDSLEDSLAEGLDQDDWGIEKALAEGLQHEDLMGDLMGEESESEDLDLEDFMEDASNDRDDLIVEDPLVESANSADLGFEDPASEGFDLDDFMSEESVSEALGTEDFVFEEPTLEGLDNDEDLVFEESLTEATDSADLIFEEPASEGLDLEDFTPEESVSEGFDLEDFTPEESASEGLSAEDFVFEESVSEGFDLEDLMAEESASEGLSAEDFVFEEPALEDLDNDEDLVFEESLTEATDSADLIFEESVSEEFDLEDFTPEESVSEGFDLEDFTPEESASEGLSAEDFVFEESVSEGFDLEDLMAEESASEGLSAEDFVFEESELAGLEPDDLVFDESLTDSTDSADLVFEEPISEGFDLDDLMSDGSTSESSDSEGFVFEDSSAIQEDHADLGMEFSATESRDRDDLGLEETEFPGLEELDMATESSDETTDLEALIFEEPGLDAPDGLDSAMDEAFGMSANDVATNSVTDSVDDWSADLESPTMISLISGETEEAIALPELTEMTDLTSPLAEAWDADHDLDADHEESGLDQTTEAAIASDVDDVLAALDEMATSPVTDSSDLDEWSELEAEFHESAPFADADLDRLDEPAFDDDDTDRLESMLFGHEPDPSPEDDPWGGDDLGGDEVEDAASALWEEAIALSEPPVAPSDHDDDLESMLLGEEPSPHDDDLESMLLGEEPSSDLTAAPWELPVDGDTEPDSSPDDLEALLQAEAETSETEGAWDDGATASLSDDAASFLSPSEPLGDAADVWPQADTVDEALDAWSIDAEDPNVLDNLPLTDADRPILDQGASQPLPFSDFPDFPDFPVDAINDTWVPRDEDPGEEGWLEPSAASSEEPADPPETPPSLADLPSPQAELLQQRAQIMEALGDAIAALASEDTTLEDGSDALSGGHESFHGTEAADFDDDLDDDDLDNDDLDDDFGLPTSNEYDDLIALGDAIAAMPIYPPAEQGWGMTVDHEPVGHLEHDDVFDRHDSESANRISVDESVEEDDREAIAPVEQAQPIAVDQPSAQPARVAPPEQPDRPLWIEVSVPSRSVQPTSQQDADAFEPRLPKELEPVDESPISVFNRPEAVVLLLFVTVLLLWQAYQSLISDAAPDGSLTVRELARRLDVNPSTINRRKAQNDFPAWSQFLDPVGIAWVYVDGVFLPQLGGLHEPESSASL